jgi:hypothetical protein
MLLATIVTFHLDSDAQVPSRSLIHTSQSDPFGHDTIDHAQVIQRDLNAAQRAGGGTVRVPPGTYWVAAGNSGAAISVPAGVYLDLTGVTLRLIENELQSYQVVQFTGQGAASGIEGGTIIGDRDLHKGKAGEWGMCISVRGATDVTIKGTKVFNCWGDGIYVGTALGGNPSPARRITIDGVEAGYNRRNNISIVAADGFRIINTRVEAASGHLPQAGIDLEPNAGNVVTNGVITDVVAIANANYGLVMGGKRGTISNIRVERVLAAENGNVGFWFQSTSQVHAKSLKSMRNVREGFVIVRSTEIVIEGYHGEGNGRPDRMTEATHKP